MSGFERFVVVAGVVFLCALLSRAVGLLGDISARLERLAPDPDDDIE